MSRVVTHPVVATPPVLFSKAFAPMVSKDGVQQCARSGEECQEEFGLAVSYRIPLPFTPPSFCPPPRPQYVIRPGETISILSPLCLVPRKNRRCLAVHGQALGPCGAGKTKEDDGKCASRTKTISTEGFPVGTASLLPASLTEISAHNSSTRRPNFCPNAPKSVKTASIP